MHVRAVGLILCLAVAAGCSTDDGQPLPAGPPAVSTAPVALLAGDCVRGQAGSGLNEVECSAAHHGEVVLSQERYFTGDALPAPAERERIADEACTEALVGYAGVEPAEASVAMSATYPTEQSWAAGDRHLTCVAVAVDPATGAAKEVTGSLKALRQ